jgi:hypothetical protein
MNQIKSNQIKSFYLLGISFFVLFSCKSDLGINETIQNDDLFTVVTPDTAYIHDLITKENELYSKRVNPNKEIVESDTNDIREMISFEKFERLPNKFNTVEEYDLMLQVIEAEVLLGLKKLIIHEELEELLEIPFLSGFDLFYLNQKGQIIIGDTLFNISKKMITSISLATGVFNTTSFEDTLENLANHYTEDYLTKSNPKNDHEIFETIKTGPTVIHDFIRNSNGKWYSVRINSQNKAFRYLGTFRARSWTKIDIKEDNTSNWFIPNENLVKGFPTFKAEVIQYTRYHKWFGSCRDRENSNSGTVKAEVYTGRCATNGVQSLHIFSIGGFTYYNHFIN